MDRERGWGEEFDLTFKKQSGVDGVKATVFSTSMDTPGRSELMGSCVMFLLLCIYYITELLCY